MNNSLLLSKYLSTEASLEILLESIITLPESSLSVDLDGDHNSSSQYHVSYQVIIQHEQRSSDFLWKVILRHTATAQDSQELHNFQEVFTYSSCWSQPAKNGVCRRIFYFSST